MHEVLGDVRKHQTLWHKHATDSAGAAKFLQLPLSVVKKCPHGIELWLKKKKIPIWQWPSESSDTINNIKRDLESCIEALFDLVCHDVMVR